MNNSQYIFGYFFVRFSRLLACLALLAIVVENFYIWQNYNLKAESIKYRCSSTLDLHNDQLEEELEFAKKDVSRISSVDDLSKLSFPEEVDRSEKFEELLLNLGLAEQRRAILKQRVTTTFAERIEVLRTRIKNTIDAIKSSRTSTPLDAENGNSAMPAAKPTDSPDLLSDRRRTVYGELSVDRTLSMLGGMESISEGLDELATSAEKEESKRLIEDAKAALRDLKAWLPSKRKENAITFHAQNEIPETPAPVDPLIKAQENYEMLGRMVEVAESIVRDGWQVDDVLLEATRVAEAEAKDCRASEVALKELRLSSIGFSGACLVLGIVLALLILVFADFLKSIFDTASNSASILSSLGNRH
jgi:hypothetical protein